MDESKRGASMPDAELITRFKSGDLEAFSELYRRYLSPVYRYIRTRVSTDRDAEDLTEMVFMKAFEALDTYEERGAPFSAYLYRIARNATIDHYRSDEPVDPLVDLEWIESGDVEIEKRLIEQQLVSKIMRAMNALPENYQEVIRLRVLLDLPTRQVAEWMGRKPSTVRVNLHRALKALRKELGTTDE